MQQTLANRPKIFSGFALKWIAMISMVVDHFGSIIMDGVLSPYKSADGAILFTADMPFFIRNSFVVKNICEIIGSIAFPIFCFLIVEGFLHTKSKLNYGILVGAFALVSEVPFNIAHVGKLFSPKLQNVMFTLCIGIFVLIVINLIENKMKAKMAPRIILTVLTIAAGMGLAFAVRGEYVFLGVLAISFLYILRGGWWQMFGFAPLLLVSPWILLAVPFALFYSGKRGKGSKYFFYIFYPAHFLVFAGVAWLLANR